MPSLVYGKVTIRIQKTNHIACEDEYDETGLDYLWTRWTFDVTGVVNPGAAMPAGAMAYNVRPGVTFPVDSPGVPATPTHSYIRDALSQPRQPLTYLSDDGNVLLTSPNPLPVNVAAFPQGAGTGGAFVRDRQLDCDCDGGPKPLRPVEITAVHGQPHTLIVRFVVSTTVNDSMFWVAQGGLPTPNAQPGQAQLGTFKPKPPILLSNRYSASEQLDEAAFSTRIYEGRCVFRMDLLRDYQLKVTSTLEPPKVFTRLAVPDDFRWYFANFICPNGFQRQQVWVQEEPDGQSCRYRVVDVQLPVTLDAVAQAKRAYKVEAVRITGTGRVRTIEDLVLWGEQGPSTLSVTAKGVEDVMGGHFIQGPIDAAVGHVKIQLAMIPRRTERFIITVTGRPDSRRADLVDVAMRTLIAALPQESVAVQEGGTVTFQEVFSHAAKTVHLTQDLIGKWVRLEADVTYGPLGSIVSGTRNGFFGNSNFIDVRNLVALDDGLPTMAKSVSDPTPSQLFNSPMFQRVAGEGGGKAPVTSSAPGVQPRYPFDNNTRGTALEWLVAQALSYPYQDAPAVPIHSEAGQRSPLPNSGAIKPT